MKEYDKALKAYQTIKDAYPDSQEGKMIDKYITALQVRMQ